MVVKSHVFLKAYRYRFKSNSKSFQEKIAVKWQHKIQGVIPCKISDVIHRDFTERELRAYFTNRVPLLKVSAGISLILGFFLFCEALSSSIHSPSLISLCLELSVGLFITGIIVYLIAVVGFRIPSDKEYEAWVQKRADEELLKGLVEIDLEGLSQKEREDMLVVQGYAVPGTKDEKNYLKEDILWKKGRDGKKHYSINVYTYVIPLEYQFASLTFHINAVNFNDRSKGIGEYFYSDVVSVKTAYERECVTIDEVMHLYHTQSFVLSTSDGKGVSVTICSLPLERGHKLPEFGFVDPRIEQTIRKMRRLLRSLKQGGTLV
jgi:hypothetical protein